jgi:hypothetical protein
MVEIHTLPILTADLQHYRPKGSLLEWVSQEEKKEHDLVLALCLAVIKKPMKGYALSLNP